MTIRPEYECWKQVTPPHRYLRFGDNHVAVSKFVTLRPYSDDLPGPWMNLPGRSSMRRRDLRSLIDARRARTPDDSMVGELLRPTHVGFSGWIPAPTRT